MNKRTIFTISMILVIVLALSGATFAWLTAQSGIKSNEFHPGVLTTKIMENGNETENENLLTPVDTSAEKEIKVKNVDENDRGVDAYIRVMLVPTFCTSEGSLAGDINLNPDSNMITIEAPDGGTITLTLASVWEENWLYKDGSFYHRSIVAPDGLTAVLLESVEVSDTDLWDTFQLEVLSDAIQAESGAAEDAWGVTINGDQELDLED